MIVASISGGQSLGKPLPELSRQGQSLCEEPFFAASPNRFTTFDESSSRVWA